ncbi:hypothetical protein SIL79_20635 [Shewanella indica]|uniref:Uncharacterized protein n=1 Tax=Shewanella indica TaxID=768528 RepID=A0ABU4QK21_9GAMM|nr:hypothetical protein [Shewanella indica]MDX6018594.1 hypothetical protein [Shewanella indica]MDX6018679.1 hypothetical protein [Shewanella indica]
MNDQQPNELKFDRKIEYLLARTTDLGIWITGAWTVGIDKARAVEYVNNYNSSPDQGFFEHGGEVILSHAGGKITLSMQEAAAIINLVRTAYM